MKYNLNNIMIGTFTVLGIACIASSMAMPNTSFKNDDNKNTKLTVSTKRVNNCKSNEIKLADINMEVGNNLSVNPKDYLKTPADIEGSVIKKLKLDTSNVNIKQVGSYIYKIIFNKKEYDGRIVVNAKPTPQIEAITLKNLSYELGTTLKPEVSLYIEETLPPEILATISLDITAVDVNTPGTYQYWISYNGKLYTNNITIYEPQYGTSNVSNKNTKNYNTAISLENKNS